MPRVILNPDGDADIGLIVIIEAKTGVIYEQQCAGHATEQRSLEGFLIPVGGTAEAKKIYDWFWDTFKGGCYHAEERKLWDAERVDQLRVLVGEIACWHWSDDGKEERHMLQLDATRTKECVEAWIPVRTPYGLGLLTLANSD